VNVGAVPDEEGFPAKSPDMHLKRLYHQREQLQSLLAAQPDLGDATDRLKELAKVSSELDEIPDLAHFVVGLSHRNGEAWRNVLGCLRKLERPQHALDFLVKVHQEDPRNAEVCCAIARQVDSKQSTEWYEKALEVAPHCTDVQAIQAVAHKRLRVDFNFVEAARLYKAALKQRRTARLLYRVGECLVQDLRGDEGRLYLEQVLQSEDKSLNMHATVMIAQSYTMAQQHDKALEFCRRSEELHADSLRYRSAPVSSSSDTSAADSWQLLKHARIYKAITQLHMEQFDLAAETLHVTAQEAPSPLDEHIEKTLGLVETLRGNLAEAERHLEKARNQRAPGQQVAPDILVNTAYLQHWRGDHEVAQNLLWQCFESSHENAMALLRMGYVSLCQEKVDLAVQFLQKCLKQPSGTLTYGACQKGAAHFYLSVALHLRACAASSSSSEDASSHEQFARGHEMLPDFASGLADCLLGGGASSSSTPSRASGSGPPQSHHCRVVQNGLFRIGMVDLNFKQAKVLLRLAEQHELVPPGSFDRVSVTRRSVATPEVLAVKPTLILAGAGTSASPTLVGTSSTAGPTSSTPSRDASGCDLFRGMHPPKGAAFGDLSARLPPEKILQFSEIELGDCISRGEFTKVHRGLLRPSQLHVVVKTVHQKECHVDEQAVAELRAEVAVFAELKHPRIVTFVGACLEPTQLALVTELAPGGNLHHALHVKHRQHFPRHERFQLATELLEGVEYLHSRSPPIAHLDLKSMNLVLSEDGQHLQICDFGLARILLEPHQRGLEGDDQSQRPVSRGGSPRYMSPECYDSSLGPLTEKADVWSSGCILIEIFGEKLPYAECSNVQQIVNLMLVHRSGPSITDSIEASVRDVIASTLHFEAQERLAIGQVLMQLQAIAADKSAGEPKSRLNWIPPGVP
jgi:tetratricopeptide (TPR) repeat protein/tRNA A-37 threonylcarbamoyl transferase component Bud32